MIDKNKFEDSEEGDNLSPEVPVDLLDLHLQLEDIKVSPEVFKEAFSNETSKES